MKATNRNITWLQTMNQTEIMLQYQSLDSRERGKLRLVNSYEFDPDDWGIGVRFWRYRAAIESHNAMHQPDWKIRRANITARFQGCGLGLQGSSGRYPRPGLISAG